jgi:acetoin utilization deacetylase AcuC-like enzyme
VTVVVCCAVLCCICYAAFELILEPIISEFDPQLVIISAGFDAAEGDFLGK